MLPKMLNSSILHWSDGLSIAWRPNVTVPDKKAALSSLKGLEPRVTKWHHNQASGKLSNCKWGGKKNTQTIFSDNLLIDNSFQILNCFTNGVYIKARRCTMNGSIIVLGKTTFTYSLIFCEEKLDTLLTIEDSWLIDKINHKYKELLSLISTAYSNNSKMLACFLGLGSEQYFPQQAMFSD